MSLQKKISQMAQYANNSEFQLIASVTTSRRCYSNNTTSHAEAQVLKYERCKKSRYYSN